MKLLEFNSVTITDDMNSSELNHAWPRKCTVAMPAVCCYMYCISNNCQLQECAPVWGCAWNLKPFSISWAMKKNTTIILIYHPFLICPSISWPLGPGPGGLSAECVKVRDMLTGGLRGAGSDAPRPENLQSFKVFEYNWSLKGCIYVY